MDETIEMFWQVDIPPSAEGAIKANANQSHACGALYYEMVSFDETLGQPRAPRSLGNLPLIVIEAIRDMVEAQRQVAAPSD